MVVLALGWSIWEIYPPTDRDLIDYVEQRAQNVDTNFTRITAEARELREGVQRGPLSVCCARRERTISRGIFRNMT